jgi:glucose/arabinose dehydrogenase
MAIRDDAPVAPAGLGVNAYMAGLDHPRWLYVLPNGDVLVAESNGPPRQAMPFGAWRRQSQSSAYLRLV